MAVKRNHAQSAMEFLMTYGWAILVLIIVISVLFYMGILNPRNVQPNVCTFSPGVSCYTFKIANGTGTLILDFGQALGKSILVTNISCSQNSSAPLLPLAQSITIPPGEHRWVLGGDTPNLVNCTDEAGNPLDSAQLGERYKGRICVAYTELDTQTNRITCGGMSGNFDTPSAGELGGAISTPTPGPTATSTSTPTPTSTPTATPTPGTALNSCTTITLPGAYTIADDFDSSSPVSCAGGEGGGDACICIKSAGVSFDCGGMAMTGPNEDTDAIYLDSVSNVDVSNCILENFRTGISMSSATNIRLESNTLSQNSFDGISLMDSSYVTIVGNDFSENGDDGLILMGDSAGNRITGNSFESNDAWGIEVSSVHGNVISGNYFSGNKAGIYLFDSTENNITSNTVTDNREDGIYLAAASGNNFTTNTVTGNPTDFYCYSQDNNIDGGNTCGSENCNWLTSCP